MEAVKRRIEPLQRIKEQKVTEKTKRFIRLKRAPPEVVAAG